MGVLLSGMIVDITEAGGLLIAAPCPDLDKLLARKCSKVVIEIPDGRRLSAEQRRKAHALIGEIAEWSGELPEFMKQHMKTEFMADRLTSIEKKLSLANCDMTVAREFISYLIDFILHHDIPTRVPLHELCDDIKRYVYATLINKKCAVCGRKGELHHHPPLGMGMDRTEAPQLGMSAICLCREHHNQVHAQGDQFLQDMHLAPVPIDTEIAKKHKFTKKAMREAT